jgi:DNA-directed RNA polymerase subunit N (RpoN/RPB10)
MLDPIECLICGRITPKEFQEKHHLTPKAKGGKNTILVCCSCGDMVHKLFTNKELARKYNTLEAILLNEDVQNWVNWVNKKPEDFTICMKNKKRKRR